MLQVKGKDYQTGFRKQEVKIHCVNDIHFTKRQIKIKKW